MKLTPEISGCFLAKALSQKNFQLQSLKLMKTQKMRTLLRYVLRNKG